MAKMPRSIHHIPDPVALGVRLRQRRIELGVSQRQLSFPGCTAAYVSRIENGARQPSRQMVDALAERLSTSRRWLETGDGPSDGTGLLVFEVSVSDVDAELGRWFAPGDPDALSWRTLADEEREVVTAAMQGALMAKAGGMAAAIIANRQARAEALARVEDELAADAERRIEAAVRETT